MSRALRRHQAERWARRALAQVRQWAKSSGFNRWTEEQILQHAQRRARARVQCSCWLCRSGKEFDRREKVAKLNEFEGLYE